MAEEVKNKRAADKTSAKQPKKNDQSKTGGKSEENSKQSDSKQAATKQAASKATDSKQSKPAKQDKKAKQAKATNKKPNIFQRFFTYLKNVRLEIKRTSWPSRNEVYRMSLIVIGALLFFGVTIYALDTLMTQVVRVYSGLTVDLVDSSTTGKSLLDLLEPTLLLFP